MKTTKYFVWAALTLALGACSDDNEFYADSKQITVEAGFGTSSRVATNGLSSIFEENDAIVPQLLDFFKRNFLTWVLRNRAR